MWLLTGRTKKAEVVTFSHLIILRFSQPLVVAVQSPSCVWLFMTPWTAVCQPSLTLTISRSLPKFMSNESVMPSNYLNLCRPLILLPSIFPSIRDFSKESAVCIRWSKYWSVSFSISPSKEYSVLISFKIDWFDLLALQATLKSLLQHHNLKASILWCSAFFIVQLSYPYMITGKTIALTIWNTVGKVMSLLFNTLSSFPVKKQLSSNFMAAVTIRSDFRAQEEEICHCFHLPPFYLP